MMPRWHYRTLQTHLPFGEGFDREIENLGQEGWELVAVLPLDTRIMGTVYLLYFKKPVQSHGRPT